VANFHPKHVPLVYFITSSSNAGKLRFLEKRVECVGSLSVSVVFYF
jgi:hypothetical protein